MDPAADHWVAYIIDEDRLLGTVPVITYMYQGVLFRYEKGHLIAKLLPQAGRFRDKPITIEFGARELERVVNLGKAGMLLMTSDKLQRHWQLFVPGKPAVK